MSHAKPTNPAIPPLPVTTSDGLHVRLSGGRRGRPPPMPPTEGDWGVDGPKGRELEETRNRLAQMEKTMRWWSDCTSNWRDKWSKVRTERNRCRDEIKKLRQALEASSQRCAQLQRAAYCPSATELSSQVVNAPATQSDSVPERKGSSSLSSDHSDHKVSDPSTANDHLGWLEPVATGSDVTPGSVERTDAVVERTDAVVERTDADVVAEKKLLMMGTRLAEAEKTVIMEREEKAGLIKALESFRQEMDAVKTECDELRLTNEQSTLQLKEVQEHYDMELSDLSVELEDSTANKRGHDSQLAELRKQFEKLQVENGAEWERRERIETEKQNVERENKRLRADVERLGTELESVEQKAVAANENSLQLHELTQKTRELCELRHTTSRLKKQLHKAAAEHEHMCSRVSEQETHVKKLRSRVDELKHDLATAQDDVDQQTNVSRRLQRTNDELQQQVDSLQVQLAHLHTRLRGRSPTRHSRRQPPRSCSLQSFDTVSSTTDDEVDAH